MQTEDKRGPLKRVSTEKVDAAGKAEYIYIYSQNAKGGALPLASLGVSPHAFCTLCERIPMNNCEVREQLSLNKNIFLFKTEATMRRKGKSDKILEERTTNSACL